MVYLVLVRHGQSQWNLENRFTGWVDVPLSDSGRTEAISAGKKIATIDFDVLYTSELIRAHETLLLVMAQTKTGKVPLFTHRAGKQKTWMHHAGDKKKEIWVIKHFALNERYYGDLQGLNKDAMRKKYGEAQVQIWRRSFAVRPPGGESLKDTCARTLPFLKSVILADIKNGKNVLVVAHGNSLRAVLKYLDNISDDAIPMLEIPTGVPYVYAFDKKMRIRSKKIFK